MRNNKFIGTVVCLGITFILTLLKFFNLINLAWQIMFLPALLGVILFVTASIKASHEDIRDIEGEEQETEFNPFDITEEMRNKYQNNKYSFSTANEIMTVSCMVFPLDNSAASEVARKYMQILGMALVDSVMYDPIKGAGVNKLHGMLKVLTMYEDSLEEFIKLPFVSENTRRKYIKLKEEPVNEKNVLRYIYMNIAQFLMNNGVFNEE